MDLGRHRRRAWLDARRRRSLRRRSRDGAPRLLPAPGGAGPPGVRQLVAVRATRSAADDLHGRRARSARGTPRPRGRAHVPLGVGDDDEAARPPPAHGGPSGGERRARTRSRRRIRVRAPRRAGRLRSARRTPVARPRRPSARARRPRHHLRRRRCGHDHEPRCHRSPGPDARRARTRVLARDRRRTDGGQPRRAGPQHGLVLAPRGTPRDDPRDARRPSGAAPPARRRDTSDPVSRSPCGCGLEERVKKRAATRRSDAGGNSMNRRSFVMLGVLAGLVGIAPAAEKGNPMVVLETSLGNIKVELYADKAPVTVKNFLDYVKAGYYNGTIFHRVIPSFMIQGGGMTADMNDKKDGQKPPIKNESSNGLKNDEGTLAMARTSIHDSATSQFFIKTKNNGILNTDKAQDGVGYAVFGKVVEGMDVVKKIEAVKTTTKAPHQNVPVEAVTIKSAKVVE